MKLVSGGQLEPADSRNFVGTARVARLPVVEGIEGVGGRSVIVYLVEFAAGARTNWHRHSAPQVLLVKEGRGLVQKWGEPVRQIAAGDAVTIEPHEKHWHGARRRRHNDALRGEPEPHHRVARARIGRPIPCILN